MIDIDKRLDVEREIQRLIGSIDALRMGTRYRPLLSRLDNASGKLGQARGDLADARDTEYQQIAAALARIRTAKALIAEGLALREEYDLRAAWDDRNYVQPGDSQ